MVFRWNSGSTAKAVRCFLRPHDDVEDRYAAVTRFCASPHRPACLVAFNYMRDGIRIRNGLFPILEMEWVEGVTLDTYIGRILGDPATMALLSLHFHTMVRSLGSFGLAHGDLQHGVTVRRATGGTSHSSGRGIAGARAGPSRVSDGRVGAGEPRGDAASRGAGRGARSRSRDASRRS